MNDYSPEPRRRGRPSNAEIAARQAAEAAQAQEAPAPTEQAAPANPRSQAAETQQRRRRRSEFGEKRNLKLYVPEDKKDPNYVYRWVNDTASGRIHNMTKLDDWDIVSAEEIENQGEGTGIQRHTGTAENGSSQRAYLCRKPKEFYEEDQKVKWDHLDAIEDDMKRGPVPTDGGLDPSKAYVPQGHVNKIGRSA